MSAYLCVGMMPNPVWPPAGIPMPGAPVQPSLPPVPKPAVTQSLPVTGEYKYFCISGSTYCIFKNWCSICIRVSVVCIACIILVIHWDC